MFPHLDWLLYCLLKSESKSIAGRDSSPSHIFATSYHKRSVFVNHLAAIHHQTYIKFWVQILSSPTLNSAVHLNSESPFERSENNDQVWDSDLISKVYGFKFMLCEIWSCRLPSDFEAHSYLRWNSSGPSGIASKLCRNLASRGDETLRAAIRSTKGFQEGQLRHGSSSIQATSRDTSRNTRPSSGQRTAN